MLKLIKKLLLKPKPNSEIPITYNGTKCCILHSNRNKFTTAQTVPKLKNTMTVNIPLVR